MCVNHLSIHKIYTGNKTTFMLPHKLNFVLETDRPIKLYYTLKVH